MDLLWCNQIVNLSEAQYKIFKPYIWNSKLFKLQEIKVTVCEYTTCPANNLFTQMYESQLIYQCSITRWLEYCRNMPETLRSSCCWFFTTCDIEKIFYLLCIFFQATIARNAKDTAHTKAERNILECVKVILV